MHGRDLRLAGHRRPAGGARLRPSPITGRTSTTVSRSRVGSVCTTSPVGFPDRCDGAFGEPRLLTATCGDVRVHNVYVPNGRKAYTPHWEAKVEWVNHLRSVVDVDRPTILAGDVNVQRADIDVYDPTRWRNRNHATPEERAALAALVELGLARRRAGASSGAGCLHVVESRCGAVRSESRHAHRSRPHHRATSHHGSVQAWIDTDERGRPHSSDHAPVVIDLDTT